MERSKNVRGWVTALDLRTAAGVGGGAVAQTPVRICSPAALQTPAAACALHNHHLSHAAPQRVLVRLAPDNAHLRQVVALRSRTASRIRLRTHSSVRREWTQSTMFRGGQRESADAANTRLAGSGPDPDPRRPDGRRCRPGAEHHAQGTRTEGSRRMISGLTPRARLMTRQGRKL